MIKTITCPRCDGQGTIAEFAHIDNGLCYLCNGIGSIEITDNGKWEFGIFPMILDDSIVVNGLNMSIYTGDRWGNMTEHKLQLKSEKWVTKVCFVLSLWAYELCHPMKAWDKMIKLKTENSPTQMADFINKEFARAEDRPYMRSKYHLYNKDTGESIYCDKDGNPLK
ncbi:MAG: hypothetical protein U9R15_04520 [Chloroflexota bacterium]|nr:hypothetical protein [Chloroflexota bacterium]